MRRPRPSILSDDGKAFVTAVVFLSIIAAVAAYIHWG